MKRIARRTSTSCGPSPRLWIAQAEKNRKQDAAFKALTAKLKNDPRDIDSLFARAEIYMQQAKWTHALDDLAIVTELQPKNAKALGLTGLCRFREGDLDRAIRSWGKAADADPENRQYQIWLKEAQQLRQVRRELAIAEQQLARKTDDGKLYARAGELWIKVRRWDKAVERLSRAVALRPNDASAHSLYGTALLRQQKMADAEKAFETCVKLEPKDPKYQKLLKQVRDLNKLHQEMKKPQSPKGDSHK